MYSGVAGARSRQAHSRRTKRWAMMALIEAESRKSGMPRSSRRVIAAMLSLVCKVESTRCPVWEAFSAISAVSLSRISPTIMTLGSCRRMERRQLAKVRPALVFTCTWLMPDITYSTGSSTVMIFRSGRLMKFKTE